MRADIWDNVENKLITRHEIKSVYNGNDFISLTSIMKTQIDFDKKRYKLIGVHD